MLKDLLETKKCFKLVCGAGNEDINEVEKLVALYSAAGCKLFDLSANEAVINAAKCGLKYSGVNDAYLCVSFGIAGDPHVNKANINSKKCKKCHKCEKICPQKAVKDCMVITHKCIGCGKCLKVCSAIFFITENKDIDEILKSIIKKGIDCIEFHAMGKNEKEIYEVWNKINRVYDGILSICISRNQLSDEKMIKRIKKMIKHRKPFTTIIQADGFPMSGGKDNFKTTLQAVAAAEIVQNTNLPVYLMLSGGTNSKTSELAHLCGIKCNGIAIGSYARKIVKEYIEREDFLQNKEVFDKALNIAKELVESV